MSEPVVTKETLRRCLAASKQPLRKGEAASIDQLHIEVLVERFSHWLGIGAAELGGRLACCANAELLLAYARSDWGHQSAAHVALIEGAARILKDVGLTVEQWDASR